MKPCILSMRLVHRLVVTLCLTALTAALPAETCAQTGRITGRVVARDTGDPLPGASIELTGPHLTQRMGALADAEGRYAIQNVPPGVYTVKVTFIGYLSVTTPNVAVADGASVAVHVRMEVSPLEMQKIIVTAQKQEEDIQEVPISITALSGRELDASRAENTLDLQYRTPGFVFKTNSVLGQPYIRGVGSDLITAGADPAVATYVDGVYLARAYSALQDFYDVERVEVMKGPQGTLFGRNATAGVVHIISRTPAPQLSVESDVTYGNYGKVRLRGLVNIPVVEDRAFLRISGLFNQRDGFTRNVYRDRRLDDEDNWGLRAQLRVVPSHKVLIRLSGDYSRERGNRNNPSHLDPVNGVNLALLSPYFGTAPADPREVMHDYETYQRMDPWGISGHISWDLGPTTLTSITAYRESDLNVGFDIDLTEIPMIVNEAVGNSRTVTQEVQAISNPDKSLEWVGGFYFLHEDAYQNPNLSWPLFAALFRTAGTVKTTAWAVFEQTSYRFPGNVRVTGGLRFSQEERRLEFDQVIKDPAGVLTGAPGTRTLANRDRRRWGVWTPKLGVDYFLKPDIMTYFTATRGFKSGGYSTDQLQPGFDPESLWAYEVGVKSTPADGRVGLNLAGFYYDYTDIQLQSIPVDSPEFPFAVVLNVPKSRVVGFEADFQVRPSKEARLNIGLTSLDAEFRNFVALDPNNPHLGEVDRRGGRMPQAPKLSVHVGAQYGWPLKGLGLLTLRGEYRYQSRMFFNIFQDPVVSQAGYNLVNARLSFESEKGRWHGELFARNVFDVVYAQTMMRLDPATGNQRWWGAPRTYGLQVGVRY